MHCGRDCLDGLQPPEHPIPLVLGSRITTYTTCATCQPLLSKDIENRWLRDVFVQVARERHPVENGRTRRNRREKDVSPRRGSRALDKAVSRHLVHPDGHKVTMRGGRPYYPGSAIRRDDGRVNIVASDLDRLRTLVAEVLATAGLSEDERASIGDVERFTPTIEDLTLSDEMAEQVMFLGVRMGAKMALSFAGEVLPEEWRVSEYAERLRRWVWSERPTNEEGKEIGWMPESGTEHPFDSDGKHFACFLNLGRTDEVAVLIRVYSTLGFTVPVAPGGTQRPRAAWLSGPSHRGTVMTTFDELLLQAARRSPYWPADDGVV